jgi:predicted RNA binding protein YcfA (HicA-like mRNA interferase family)
VSFLPVIPPDRVIAALRRAGYEEDHQTGAHVILYKEGRLPVTVPNHNRDLKKGTLRQIIRSAGLSVDEFVQLLRG